MVFMFLGGRGQRKPLQMVFAGPVMLYGNLWIHTIFALSSIYAASFY